MVIILVVLLTIFIVGITAETDSYLAMCLIVKDEHENIVEWIEYHKRMGVTKIYMFDHNSTYPMSNYITNFVTSNLVDYVRMDPHHSKKHPQIGVYNQCLKKYGHLHNFIAFIDSDEYIVVPDKRPIPKVLTAYEQYGGVVLNWMGFGSSGHVNKPEGGVIANYYKCHKQGTIKSIVNTKYGINCKTDPHHFAYKEGHPAVNTAFQPVNSTHTNVTELSFQIMYINHYFTRSLVEFAAKMARGRAVKNMKKKLTMEWFHEYDAQCNSTCPILEMPPE